MGPGSLYPSYDFCPACRMRPTRPACACTSGCRLPIGDQGGEVVALPLTRDGYTAMNRSLTDLAHGRIWAWPEAYVLLANRWATALQLREAAPDPALVQLRVERSGWQLSQRARAEGLPVVGPQVLRFWKAEGFGLHKVTGPDCSGTASAGCQRASRLGPVTLFPGHGRNWT